MSAPTTSTADYAARLTIDYPDRDLDRLSTALRIFYIIPIAIVLGLLTNAETWWAGVIFLPLVVMILFRQKYPGWWFDFNLELTRFSTRIAAYLALMSDTYPSTTEEQYVHLELDRPDVERDLNRWLPLVKWILAIPHFIVLAFLSLGAFFAAIAAWFAILFTGRYPQPIFEFIEGVMRWWLRVEAYAFLLITDQYPPFRLS